MTTTKMFIAFAVTTAALALLNFGLWQYPYFVSWDMDLITAIDLMRIEDELIPLHITHPAIGMYLLLKPWFLFARMFGIIEVSSFEDLRNYLNPIIGVAQLVDWTRALNPFLIVGIGLSTWSGVQRLAGKHGFWIGLLSFAIIIFSPAIWFFHLPTNRSELFSLFYASLAFMALSFLLTAPDPFKKENVWPRYVFYVLAGLALITKIQALFVVFAFLVLFELKLKDSPKAPSPIASYLGPFAALLFWGGLIVLGFLTPIPKNFATFSKATNPNIFFYIWLAILTVFYLNFDRAALAKPLTLLRTLLRAPQTIQFFKQRALPDGKKLLVHFEFAWIFGLLIFAVPLLALRSNPLETITYYFKMIFLNISDHSTAIRDASFYLANILWSIKYLSLGLIALVFGSALAIYKSSHLAKWILISVGLFFLNVIVATRPEFKDAIWNELFLVWITSLIFGTFIQTNYRHLLFSLAFLAIGISHLTKFDNLPPFLNASTRSWFSDSWRFRNWVYDEEAPMYQDILNRNFNDLPHGLQKELFRQAENPFQLQALVKKTWLSPQGSMREVGLLRNGAPLLRAPTTQYFQEVPFREGLSIIGSTALDAFELYLEDNRDYWILASKESAEVHSTCFIEETQPVQMSNYRVFSLNNIDKKRICRILNHSSSRVYLVTTDNI